MPGRIHEKLHMTAQAGIVVGGDSIRAVLLERGVEVWRAEASVEGIDSIARAAAELLANAPPRFRRASLGICVTRDWSQTKPLPGVPPVKKARLATQIVRENLRAFFLLRGTPLDIADVLVRSDGMLWGAAFDRDGMTELTRSLRGAQLRVDRIVPLAIAKENTRDSDDATVAARMPRRLPLSWRPAPDASRARTLSFLRVSFAASAIAAAALFALFGPGIRAARFSRAAAAELIRTQVVQRELSRTQRELQGATETLNRIAAFQASRGAMSRILGGLSQSLPESTALLAFHVDSTEGGFTAIAPRIADVLPELVAIEEIAAPKIVGSVTRETISGVHIERATFRFRRTRTSDAKARAQ